MKQFLKFVGVVFLIFIGISVLAGILRLFNHEDHEALPAGNIAVIEVEGVIQTSLEFLEKMDEIRRDPRFKAVVVRVNSPGGGVGASQEIYMELRKLREKLPVIISMGDMAASGGLYVSVGGQYIFTLPGTLTGSMGVLLQLTQFNRLLEKIYVDPLTLKSGELKDAGNPTHAMAPEARKHLQDLIQKNFEEFRKTVVAERKLKPEVAELLSDGRVVDGNQAVTLGLADKVGTFQDAVDYAKEKAGLKGDVKLSFVMRHPEPWWKWAIQESLSPLKQWVSSQDNPLQYRWELAR